MRIDAVLSHAVLVEHFGDATRFSHGEDKALAISVIAHCRAAHRARPHRRDERADHQAFAIAILSAIASHLVVAGVGSVCGWNKEKIDAFELLAVTLAAAVSSSIRSRLIGGWSVPGSLPTRPGHMAL